MEMITSRSNSTIKWIRSLQEAKARRQEKCYLAEGVRILEEAGQIEIHTLIFCPELTDANPRAQKLVARLQARADRTFQVTPYVLQSISETVVSQGIIAVLPMNLADVNPHARLNLILDGISDPGNMGAILRTARAAAVDQVFMSSQTVDVYNAKVVRSAMGAHFHLPLMTVFDWKMIAPDSQIVLARAKATRLHTDIDWRQPTTVIIGSEAHGIKSALPNERLIIEVKISMAAGVESLNASVAAGVILMTAYQARNK